MAINQQAQKQWAEFMENVRAGFKNSKEFNKQLRILITAEMNNERALDLIYEDIPGFLADKNAKRTLVNKLLLEHINKIAQDILGKHK